MKQLLAILGSPHECGATAAMLDCAVQAAGARGFEIKTINLYHQKIEYCKGCKVCDKTAKCVIDDDIQHIADLMKSCDQVILAAPTYWANVPAVVKNMFDRLVGTAMEETAAFPRPRFSSKQKYLLLTSCHTPFPFCRLFGQSSGALRAMHEFFKTGGMKRMGTVTFSNKVCRQAGTLVENKHRKTELPQHIRKKIEKFWRL